MKRTAIAIAALSLINPLLGHAQEADNLLAPIFEQYAKYEQFSGAVRFDQNGQTLIRDGFGFSDRELSVPAAAEHRFVIGSISKSFNAALVVSLARDGLFDLDDAVIELWPEFNDPSGGRITMRHLLTHQSGLPHWGARPDFLHTEALRQWDPAELVNYYTETGLQFEPGTEEDYSSVGFMAAAVAIQELTGTPYHQLLRDRLLEPLGMMSTTPDGVALIEGRAADYRFNFVEGRYENGEFRHPSTQFGTGDLVSTVDDLTLWAAAMRGQFPEIVGPEVLSVLLDPHSGSSAFGWNRTPIIEDTESEVVWHGGLVAGYRSQIVIDLSTGHSLVMLGNLRDIQAGRITRAVFAAVENGEAPPVPRDLMREILQVSAVDGNDVAIDHIQVALAQHADQYYEDPIAWAMAAVELRSDGACDRAIDIYAIWLELNPDHAAYNSALRHATDCALQLRDLDRAELLIAEFESNGADPEYYARLVQRLEELRQAPTAG